ncbi:MAG: hypothetical protein HY393_01180 [Candidatus Diapherotrites archaeon]|nr:hypothetical protein [Candidatus Diapherotrites archaeon]
MVKGMVAKDKTPPKDELAKESALKKRVGWAFGGLIVLGGISILTTGSFSGLFFIASGAIFLPPIIKILEEKSNIKLTLLKKIGLFILLLSVGTVFYSPPQGAKTATIADSPASNTQPLSNTEECIFPELNFIDENEGKPYVLENEELETILEKADQLEFQSTNFGEGWKQDPQGWPSSMTCRRGKLEGENTNYLYCGVPNGFGDTYELSKTKVYPDGTIGPTKKLTLRLVFDMTEPPINGKYKIINPQCQYTQWKVI